jgi:hypothetical protein
MDWSERIALVRAAGLLLAARMALLLLPLRRVLEFASRVPETDRNPRDDPFLQRMSWAVDVVARRLFPRNPCLTQAVVVQRLFRKRGRPAELRIGVRKEHGATLEAHAWVESEGEILIGARGLAPDHVALPPLHLRRSPQAR